MAKKLQEEELRLLFNEGITNQFGKKKTAAASKAASLGIAEANQEVSEYLEGLSSDDSDDDDSDDGKGGKRRPTFVEIDEPTATHVYREKTIEDIIEEQRAKLAAEGKQGTPVNAETFAAWRKAKLAQRQAEAEARVKAEQAKKKGGKGLSVLSGKELFNFNRDLFVDDDAALDEKEESALSTEMAQRQEQEERAAKEESDRIQAEQERLAQLQQVEFEVRRQKEKDRRIAAAAPDRPTFQLAGVVINQVVFEDDEEEDLTLFPETQFVEAAEREAVMIVSTGSSSSTSEGAGMDVEEEQEEGQS
mmetsp:Transcript_11022/g.18495  ORF Transcript_11022/g.18495 Transcript_11022/m.18495 type:complete len:305 (+) Transcript_11022:420-1334(+)